MAVETTQLRTITASATTYVREQKPTINYKPFVEHVLGGRLNEIPEKLRGEVQRLFEAADSHGLRGEVEKQMREFEKVDNDYFLNLVRRTTNAIDAGTLQKQVVQEATLELIREVPGIADSAVDSARRLHELMGAEFDNL